MASTNVTKFAAELKMPAEVLLEQLRTAGVNKRNPDDEITEADKEQLLVALRRMHGGEESSKKKITLTRKQTSEIKQADATGKARTIQVEVRKKRVFVKRDEAAPPEEAAGPSAEELELARRELNLEVVERSIDRSELYVSDEAFFTGTAVEVGPITAVDHRPVGNGAIGPVSRELRRLYLEATHGHMPRYRHWLLSIYQPLHLGRVA